MPASIIPSFLYYCLINGITPGPANLTSLSTAIRMGKKSALSQWRGLFTGFAILSFSAALLTYFVGTQLTEYVRGFSYIGAAYIVWLAYHIATDRGDTDAAPERKIRFREGTFLYGLALQLSNVKVIIFCITALAGFVLPYSTDLKDILLAACFLPFTGPLCNLVWLFAGVRLQGLFRNHRTLINLLMAVSLLFCAVSMVL